MIFLVYMDKARPILGGRVPNYLYHVYCSKILIYTGRDVYTQQQKMVESIIFAFITIGLYVHNICIKLQWNPGHNSEAVSVQVNHLFFYLEELISGYCHFA